MDRGSTAGTCRRTGGAGTEFWDRGERSRKGVVATSSFSLISESCKQLLVWLNTEVEDLTRPCEFSDVESSRGEKEREEEGEPSPLFSKDAGEVERVGFSIACKGREEGEKAEEKEEVGVEVSVEGHDGETVRLAAAEEQEQEAGGGEMGDLGDCCGCSIAT